MPHVFNRINIKGGKQLSSEGATAEELLAEIKPNDIQVDIKYFQSDTLPKLPNTIKILSIFGTRIGAPLGQESRLNFIEEFPETIQDVIIYYERLEFLSRLPKFPATLNRFRWYKNGRPYMKIQRENYRDENGTKSLVCTKSTFEIIEKVIRPTDYRVTIEAFQEPVLPRLPDTVKALLISKSLPNTVYNLPPSLFEFYCAENNFKVLPELPLTLQILYCSFNPLGQLPELPPNLTKLYCANCNLRELPELPDTLRLIICFENRLISFPPFPPGLQEVNASSNQLTRLPKMRRFTPEEVNFLSINFHENPLREPFASFYRDFEEVHQVVIIIEDVNARKYAIANNYNLLADRIDAYDNKIGALQSRQENTRRDIERVRRIQQTFGQAGPLPPELAAAVGSFYSGVGNLGSRSLNQQIATLRQRLPEYQPVGVTQQPFVPEHLRRKQNSNTRMRLRKLLSEEKNIQRKGLKGGKRTTRRHRKKGNTKRQ